MLFVHLNTYIMSTIFALDYMCPESNNNRIRMLYVTSSTKIDNNKRGVCHTCALFTLNHIVW